ncbi:MULTISPECIES: baeRF2 domain-containing protein [unclassified Nocardioides]|uniref:baeRF2 domain-containing protein n=1 Tax=Nocardioides sp. URHA0032 TaxID=1380388 RepID=UPI0004907D59|nr:Vms1/Ankzf1 family peptidyl-tRNA hydrolase [Nocardioides sp. URHA0032]
MDTSTLSELFQSSGPFATAFVDVGHENENGEHEHELRVRAACEQLRDQGADDKVVALVAERLGELPAQPSPVARVVVANADGVGYDELASTRVDVPTATWAPLPDLARWIEHRDSAVTFVLALVDHEGGDVALYSSDVPAAEEEASVGGEERFVHQVPVGGWSALRYQRNTENVWARNAEAVVDEVVGHVRRGHRLVLLAGDPQSRGLVRDKLAGTEAELVELETGSRADDGGDDAQAQAVREALLEQVVTRRLGRVHELRERLGRGEGAVAGIDDVTEAFVRGQVDTLLIDPAAAAEQEIDPRTYRGLSIGTQETVRADLALVAAAVLTSASVTVAGRTALGNQPVAALLRWDQ